jgi:hypothetical protein
MIRESLQAGARHASLLTSVGYGLPETLFVGLAMMSHNASETSTAHFDGLEIQKG